MSTSPLIAFQEVASRRRMVVAEIPPIEETIVRPVMLRLVGTPSSRVPA